jgi:hypothetical protein
MNQEPFRTLLSISPSSQGHDLNLPRAQSINFTTPLGQCDKPCLNL